MYVSCNLVGKDYIDAGLSYKRVICISSSRASVTNMPGSDRGFLNNGKAVRVCLGSL